MKTTDQTQTDRLLSKLQSSRAKQKKLEAQLQAQIKTVAADTEALAKVLNGQTKPVEPSQPEAQV
jgi:hypothetical protein